MVKCKTIIVNFKKNHNECHNISWSIRVFASNTIGFLKDTIKEDCEQNLKDGWETAEPGRSELAKTSRQFYLVRKKKSMGEAISEKEEKVLKMPPRERKLSLQKNLEELPKIKSKENNLLKRRDSNNVKKKEENLKPVVNHEYQTDFNKTNLPTLQLHTALDIRNFLSYCYDERTIKKDSDIKPSKSIL